MIDLFYDIDPDTMILAALFVIFFAIINFALMRAFKQKATAAVIAICISLLAVYGINRTGFDLTSWFYGIGVSEEILYILVPILVLIFLIFLSTSKDKITQRRKFLWHRLFIIPGIIFIILSRTDLIYEKSIVLIVGAALFLIGLKLWMSKRKKEKIAKMDWWERQKFEEKQRRSGERIEKFGGAVGRKLGETYGRAKYERQQAKGQMRAEQQQRAEERQRQEEIRERAKNIARIREERLRQERVEEEGKDK